MSIDMPVRAVATARSFEANSVQTLAAQVGLSNSERQQLRDGGLMHIPVATVSLVELVAEVLSELALTGWRPETCTSVIFTHSLELADNEVMALERMLRDSLPRLSCHPLVVTGRPCSIIHFGIEVAVKRQLLRPSSTVLVLGADVARTTDDRFFFGSAMGDSAVGLVLGDKPISGHLLAVVSTHHVIAPNGTASGQEEIQRFRAQNPTAIRATITAALNAAGLKWHDLAAIVPHTPYRAIWDTIATLCRFPRARILDDELPNTGHLNSNDVLVHFAAAVRQGRLNPGDVVALVSPGFGGTRGCTLIRSNIHRL
jgi:3-oxoacyl-[acyl-carrier-protein] synthase-3